MTGSITLLDIGFAVGGLYLLKRILEQKPVAPLPPGPKGLPVVGNVADMPKEYEWKAFSDLCDNYGELCSLTVLGQPLIILGSYEKAVAMLDKKSSIYSDRPILQMCGELVGWCRTVALTQYGERFRSIRRLMHGVVGSRAAVQPFAPMLELETHRLLRRILERPEAPVEGIRQTAGAVILRMSHGYAPKERKDAVVECVDLATNQFSESSAPGAFLVDILPALKHVPAWFPGAGFQRKAAAWRSTMDEMANVPHDLVKKQMAAGTALPSLTSTALSEKAVSPEEEETIKWAAASMYSGGADTTVSANYVFYLAMTLYPEAQKKAQAELDAVLGPNCLPTLADRDSLPYVTALVDEVFRWQPVGPLAIPHRASADDVHDGFLIPAGSIVFANVWRMTRNPAAYPDPETFDPARFLGPTPAPDPKDIVFGFGRRVCPGRQLALASVWLACAGALAMFDVCKAKDEAGREITPVPEMTSGTISHPKPFKCVIRPRSERAEALVRGVEFERE